MELATHRIIDSVWTVAYTVGDDGRATIHGYDRGCEAGVLNEKSLNRCALLEGAEGRTVTELVVQPRRDAFHYGARQGEEDAATFEVANPQNIFSYGEVPS